MSLPDQKLVSPKAAGPSEGAARVDVFVVPDRGEAVDLAAVEAALAPLAADHVLRVRPMPANAAGEPENDAFAQALAAERADAVVVLRQSHATAANAALLIAPILDGRADACYVRPHGRAAKGTGKDSWGLLLRLALWPLKDRFDPSTGLFAVGPAALAAIFQPRDAQDLGLKLQLGGSETLRVEAVTEPQAPPAHPGSWAEVAGRLRHAAEVAGATLSYGTAAKFGAVGLGGMVIDLAAFRLFMGLGWGLAASHTLSFAISAVLNFSLNARWTFHGSGRQRGGALVRQYLRFLFVILLALAIRGGILGLAVDSFGMDPQIAILLGIGFAAGISFLGNAFFVFPLRAGQVPPLLRWRTAAVGVFVVALVLRLIFLAQPNLMPEEAYYWGYARHLNIGYLDHPPMVAWSIWLSTHLFGTNEFGVRFPAVVAGLLVALFQYRYARNLYGKSAALVTVLLVAALPYFFIDSLMMSPDATLAACWAGTLFFLERALLAGKGRAWIGAGVCLGLGMLSKYTIILLGPAALLFMATDREARRWLLRPPFYIAALVAVALFSPVIIWNAQHHWASFVFQGARRVEAAFRFGLGHLILDIIGLLSPVGALAAVEALGAERQDARHRRRWRFLAFFTLVPLSVFFVFSLSHAVKPNWTGPIWLALLPAIAARAGALSSALHGGTGWMGRALKASWKPMVAVLLLFYGFGLNYLALGLPGIGYARSMHGAPVSWRAMAAQALAAGDAVEKREGRPVVYVGLDKYTFSSEISFYALRDHGRVVMVAGNGLFGGNGLMFDRWVRPDSVKGRTLLLFSFGPGRLESPEVAAHCTSLGSVTGMQTERNGKPAGHYFYRVCTGYNPI